MAEEKKRQPKKMDARGKFETAQSGLEALKKRLYESRKKEERECNQLQVVAAKRKKLMAKEYLDKSRGESVALKAIHEDLRKADAKLADTVAISEELADMLREKKGELMQLELDYVEEAQQVWQERSDAVSKEYRDMYQELVRLREKATDMKREVQKFQGRQRILEREMRE